MLINLILSRENFFFQTNCQTFKIFSFMDSCNFNTLFIKSLKHNINAPFPSYKLSWIQNDGDLVVSQRVKDKLFIGYYAKNNLSHIVPLEAYGVLLK